MTALYLASFVVGLLLAARVMMYGVERTKTTPGGKAERSFRLSPAVMVAFTLVFGVLGYVLTRANAMTPLARFLIAAASGGLSALVAARLVKTWWHVTPEHDVDDERYVLQGQVARVTKAVAADVDGEVAVDGGSGGSRRLMTARSFDNSALPVGTEVVIERVENGIAYVEAWVEVEKRL